MKKALFYFFLSILMINASAQSGSPTGSKKSIPVSNVSNFFSPTVSSTAATVIRPTSASLGGNVTDGGSTSVSERGIVYSSSNQTPTIGANGVTKDANASGTGVFSETISGLASGTTYYFRAYAINSVGTSYGSVLNFKTAYNGGTGTVNDPYKISTLVDLVYLSEHSADWTSYFKQTADINASTTSTMNSNGSGGYYGFSPIGSDLMHSFQGQYDGDEHRITNLFINRPSTDFVGLFGYVSFAIITDLGVDSLNITGHDYVGGMFGANYISTKSISSGPAIDVQRCYTTGSVTGNTYVGGFGGFEGSWNNHVNCYSRCSVNGTNYLSGFISNSYGWYSNCYVAGVIQTASSSGAMDANASYYASVTGCFYDEDIDGNHSSAGYLTLDSWPLTTASMKTQSNFTNAGWDFVVETANGVNDYWKMSANTNDGYPAFFWQPSSVICTLTAATSSQTDVACNGGSTGSLTVTPSGGTTPYTYLWSGGGTTASKSSLAAGIYTVTVTDASSCTATVTDTILQPSALSATLGSKTNVSTYGGSDGAITVNYSGGTTPYTYSWSNAATTANVSGVTAAIYTVTVTDNNQCTATYTTTVTQPDYPYSGGSGLSNDPYQISTITDLVYLSEHSSQWSKYFIQTADINAATTASMNSNGSGGYFGFSPIGNAATKFTGGFDGDGHITSNLYINRPAQDYVGLFGYTFGGIAIKDLGLDSVQIVGNNYVGGFVGYASGTTLLGMGGWDPINNVPIPGPPIPYYSLISLCFVNGSVEGTGTRVGGFAGYGETYVSFSNSYTRCTVGNAQASKLGGFIGDYSSCTFNHCFTVSTVANGTNRGAFAGAGSSYQATCYFDATYSSFLTDILAYSKTTAQMKTQGTFVGFDFVGETANGSNSYWKISAIYNDGYPALYYEPALIDCALSSNLGSQTKPVATAATEIGATGFTANWDALLCADDYYLDVATDSLFSNFVSGYNAKVIGNDTLYQVTGLTINDTLYYRVRGYNSSNTSNYSDTIQVALTPSNFLVNSDYYNSFSDAVSAAQGSSIQMIRNYTLPSSYTLTNNVSLDLNGYTFSGTGTVNIASMKQLTLRNSNNQVNGTWNASLAFGDVTSSLGLTSAIAFGADFAVDGVAYGTLSLGDGTSSLTFTIDENNVAKFTKFSTIQAKMNSSLIINSSTGLTCTIQVSDMAICEFGDGTHAVDVVSTTQMNNSMAVIKANTCTFTGDWTGYYGDFNIQDGKTATLDFDATSINPFRTAIGSNSNTLATKLIKKGGAYSIGDFNNQNSVVLYPYSVLDLTDSLNSGTLTVYGDIYIYGSSSPNSAYLKFILANNSGTISAKKLAVSNGAIATDEIINGSFDCSKNIVVDMHNIIATAGQTYSIEVFTSSDATNLTGIIVPINAATGWKTYTFTEPNPQASPHSYAFGALYDPCENPTSGGTLSDNQIILAGTSAATITSVQDPTGQLGTLEYRWQKSTIAANSGYTVIANSNASTYSPGLVAVPTWYRRQARVSCKGVWTGAVNSTVAKVTPLPERLYVTEAGAGTKSGLDWANAMDATQLQAAIAGAYAEVWVAAGTYYPTTKVGGATDRHKAFQLREGLAVYGGFAGTETTLNQRNVLSNNTILSGDIGTPNDSTDNCYHVIFNNVAVTPILTSDAILDGFTIKFGNADGVGNPINSGGGMYNLGHSPSIANCIFSNNYAYFGGGMRIKNASPVIENCTFTNNRADDGAGVFNSDAGTPSFTNCIFSYNAGESGGGVQNNLAGGTFTGCEFHHNSATTYGAGVQNRYAGTSNFLGCKFYENTAVSGGAAIVNDTASTANYSGCLIYNNTTQQYGGAVVNYTATATFINSTITQNSANIGGGIASQNSTLTIANSIVWGNEAASVTQIVNSGCTVTIDHSCYASGPNDFYDDPAHPSQLTTTDNVNTDPEFVNYENDFTFYGFSPCLNSGDNAYIASPYQVISNDIRGEARTQSNTIDMGAYEWTNNVDPLPLCSQTVEVENTNNSGSGSLRQALLLVCDGGTITFDASLNGQTIVLSGSELLIKIALTIDASALADGIFIDGNDAIRVMNMNAGSEKNITLKNIHLINGYSAADGAGLYVNSGNRIVLENSSVSGCYAVNGAGIYVYETDTLILSNSAINACVASSLGGGLYMNAGTLTSSDNSFKNDTAFWGGALFLNNANSSFTADSLVANSAVGTGSAGGAFWLAAGTASFTNSVIKSNKAKAFGGAVYVDQNTSNLSFNHCSLDANMVEDGRGGAIFLNEGNIHLRNQSQLVNNMAVYATEGGHGGAIYNFKGSILSDTCAYKNNSASIDAGAIMIHEVAASFTSHGDTLSGNLATGMGGAIYVYNGALSMAHSRLADNQNSGKGGAINLARPVQPIFLDTCIFSQNKTLNGSVNDVNWGGALMIDSAAVFVTGCQFTGNTATRTDANGPKGGAIFLFRGALTVNGSQFTSNSTNTTQGKGGAIFNDGGELSVAGSSFTSNASGRTGGAIFNYSVNAVMFNSKSTFTSNTAGKLGGALYMENGTMTNDSCIFDSNSATVISGAGGGAVDHNNGVSNTDKCIFKNNSSVNGAGFYIKAGTATLASSVFYGNQASANGGALFVETVNATLTVVNNTITGNSATTSGGGIAVAAGGIINIQNSILWNDTSATGNEIANGSQLPITVSNSCLENPASVVGSYVPVMNTSENPVFKNEAGHDYSLYSHSPCVNTGSNFDALIPPFNMSDVRGKTRTQDNTVDMGAYEWTSGTDPILTYTNSITHVTCHSLTNGAVALTVTATETPVTYLWSNGSSTEDLAGLAAGTYTVTMTDANSYSRIDSFEVTEPDTLVVSLQSQTNVSCYGLSNGSTTVSVSGGTLSYLYQWTNTPSLNKTPPQAGPSKSNLSAGTYTVTVTDGHSCTDTLAVTITQPDSLIASIVDTDILCYGDANGALDLSVSGGTTNYSYSWSNNASTQDLTALTPGIYSVIVTDAHNCTAIAVDTISQPDEITADAGIDQQICYDGTVTLAGSYTVAGGAIWSGGTGTFDPDNTTTTAVYTPSAAEVLAGTVTLTLTTTGNGTCNAADDDIELTIYPEPYIAYAFDADVFESGDTILYCYGATTSMSVDSWVGTLPFTHVVNSYFNGSPSESNDTIVMANLNSLSHSMIFPLGFYENDILYFVDAHGCESTQATLDDMSVVMRIVSNPTAVIASNDPVCDGEAIEMYGLESEISCTTSCGLPSGYCSSYANILGYQYISKFSLGNTSHESGPTQQTKQPIQAFKTVYLDSTYVLAVTIDGPQAYDHYNVAYVDWNRDGDFDDLGEMTQIGSAIGTGEVSTTITIPSNATLGRTYIRVINRKNFYAPACGDYPVGETENYILDVKSIETGRIVSYSWSGPAGTNSVKNWVITPATEASAGTYSITVTDGNGCSAATSHDVIVANPQIDFSQVVTDQEAPFILQLNPGTFQDYSWSNGSTESSIIVNEFGTYTVTVSDYDCYDTESVTFNEYQDISLAQGWGMFSTYINQTNNIADVMNAITNSIFLVKNNSGQVYWPVMTINNINNMVIGQGYQVKMSQSALLTIVGTSVLPQNTPVQLNAGINTIGMLRHTPVSAADLFAPVVQDLVYVKLNNGMVYLPQYQVNQVVTMYPDDAFKVMMLHSGVITYPANNDNLPDKGAYELRETAYYAAVTNSGNNMTLVLPQAVVQGLLKDGDEVAVYTANNLLVGSAVYTGETLAMPVWGQDETQQQKSGLSASESFILEVYNHQNGLTTRFENVEYESGDGSYHDNSVAVVKTLNLNLNLKLSLYPNPATDYVDVNFSLPEATSARIELYNALGQLVLGKSIDNQEGEQHHSITVSHLPAGTYTLKLITKSEIKEASLIVH